ncbi:MAG: ABC transporter ATP-binding protein [Chloroflexi bacterium]|nr:ABC transporter ATP-binding protein [Chloroflexota bacterium]MBU1750703.1 ABC transporter ATP-binding protein [Chloroflexota bacterium]
MNNDMVVQTRELTRVFGDGDRVVALDHVTLDVPRGQFMAVMGPSGSGKSTLLHLLGALDRPSSGQVIINDQDLTGVKNLDAFRSRTVGFVFQMHNLIPTLTARENVEVPMHEQKRSGRDRSQRAQELLELVGLAGRVDFLPNQLSGGERQRVAIARSLANEPAIVLADEPTGNLDSVSGEEIVRLFQQLNQDQGVTIILVTHDPAVARMTRRVVTLRDGRVHRDELVASPFMEDLRDFKSSGLGKALLTGDVPAELTDLGDGLAAEALRELLAQV